MDNYLMVGAVGLDVDAWQGGFYDQDLPADWRAAYYSTLLRSVLLPETEWRNAIAEEWFDEVDIDFRFVLQTRLTGLEALLDLPQGLADRVVGSVVEIPFLPLPVDERDRLRQLADKMPVCLDRPAAEPAPDDLDALCRQLGLSRVWHPSAQTSPLDSGRLLVAIVEDVSLQRQRELIGVLEGWKTGNRTAGLFHEGGNNAAERAQQTRLLAEMMGI
jgi:hypothetical protein